MMKVDLEQVRVRFSEILLLVQKLAQQQRDLEDLKARLSREKDGRDGKNAGGPRKRFPTAPRSGRR